MRISDWSSDVCSSDLPFARTKYEHTNADAPNHPQSPSIRRKIRNFFCLQQILFPAPARENRFIKSARFQAFLQNNPRSEEHTSELQSLMRISYAVFCLKKQNVRKKTRYNTISTIPY